jgi:hypothetical protein
VRLKVFLITVVGLVGLGSSIALADGGHHDGAKTTTNHCTRAEVHGTLAPQTFTVTVQKANRHSGFKPGDTVTVTVGGTGDTVVLSAEGCADGSALAARGAVVRVWDGKGHHGHDTTTESTTTSQDTTTAETTTNK